MSNEEINGMLGSIKKKMIIIVTALFLAAAVLVVLRIWTVNQKFSDTWENYTASSFAQGTGTAEDPYVIKTAEELAYLAKSVNSGESTEGKWYTLGSDINLSGHVWKPIGTGNDFEGTFNGLGRAIKGLNIETRKNVYNYGLFGSLKGEVYNLEITGANVNVSYLSNRKLWQKGNVINVGILAGKCTGTIAYVDVNGKILTENVGTLNVGMLGADVTDSFAKSDYASGDIKCLMLNEHSVIGGAFGCAKGKLPMSRVGTKIDYSLENDGEIMSKIYCAGLIGNATELEGIEIENSYALSDVKVNAKKASIEAYGLLASDKSFGENDLMKYCYCKGDVSLNGKAGTLACIGDYDENIVVKKAEDGENTETGLVACGYFKSGSKFMVYGGKNAKKLDKKSASAYFREKLGYTKTNWYFKNRLYPINRINMNSFIPEVADKEQAVWYVREKKAYYYENGKRNNIFTGTIEYNGESYEIVNGKATKK